MSEHAPAADRSFWSRAAVRGAGIGLVIGLAWFYVYAATEHARVLNQARVRADQSGYLWDAVAVYQNWHGQDPPHLIGERNRMPLYPGFLALLYDPALSPDQFFERAKAWNIRLSLLLLALLAVLFRRHLPLLPSLNLTLIVAFGYFVFKAGYAQAELPFYVLIFATFLTLCRLLQRRARAASLGLAALAGLLAALSHLTKAAVLPLVGVFLAVYGIREVVLLARICLGPGSASRRHALHVFAWRTAAAVVLVASFLGVLYPYIATSKRVFGRYFYNVNTTFYAWYDDWPEASVGTYKHGDGVGWPKLPPALIPSPRRYWRTHTAGQIAARIADGLAGMATESYRLFGFGKYAGLYLSFTAVLIASNRRWFLRLLRSHAALSTFLALYAVVYLLAIAFYKPVGTTTGRFLLAHIAPLMFVLSVFFARPPFSRTQWKIAGVSATPGHFHLLVLVTMGLDLGFGLWPRLMSSFTGY